MGKEGYEGFTKAIHIPSSIYVSTRLFCLPLAIISTLFTAFTMMSSFLIYSFPPCHSSLFFLRPTLCIFTPTLSLAFAIIFTFITASIMISSYFCYSLSCSYSFTLLCISTPSLFHLHSFPHFFLPHPL